MKEGDSHLIQEEDRGTPRQGVYESSGASPGLPGPFGASS